MNDPYEELLRQCLDECSSNYLELLTPEDRALLWDIVKTSKAIRGFLGAIQMEINGKHLRFEEMDYTDPASNAKAEGLKGKIRGMRRVLDIFKEALTDVRPEQSIQPTDPGYSRGGTSGHTQPKFDPSTSGWI